MQTLTASADARRPRAPGLLQISVVLVMLVLLAAVALTARQEAPPSIAEFAPQAVEQIKESLPEQSGDEGEVAGGRGTTTTTAAAVGPDGRPVPTTLDPSVPPPPPVVDVPRVRRCVGEPPRQTEDPQSPPCVPYFDGDNGGETTKGVTANEIRIAYPLGFFEDKTLAHDILKFFNSRYEFYGRKLVFKEYDPVGGGFAQPVPKDMQADAVKVDEELKAFATIGYVDRKGAEHHHYDELARRKVISSAYRAQIKATEERYTNFAPYEWNVLPGIDTMLRTYGTFICKSLAGQPPRHAGPRQNGAPQRVFGLVYQRTPDGTIPDLGLLESAMASCGATFKHRIEEKAEAPDGSRVIGEMQRESVTSIFCICDNGTVKNTYMAAATQQAFFPEWLLSSMIDNDVDNSFQAISNDQTDRIIGLSYRNRMLDRQDSPWYWAVKEHAPEKDPTAGTVYSAASRYAQLSLLAAGIQMAGPKLTPKAFEVALHTTKFSNPGAGGPPYYQARVGFDGGRHTMINDATLFWYDVTEPGTVDPSFPGAVCYVRAGLRYNAANWPTGEQPFRAPPCK